MKNLKTLILFACLGISLADCKKKDDDTVEKSIGGKGGSAVIHATPQHHGRNIDSCTIYIKYNATNLPTTFDDSAKCVQLNGKPVATFSGLKKGDYYFYGYGWDPGISQNVRGGIAYTITTENTQQVNVPVSEE
jgi:hypothetical protein